MVSNEKCEENRFMSKMASVHASKSLRDANDGGILYTVAKQSLGQIYFKQNEETVMATYSSDVK